MTYEKDPFEFEDIPDFALQPARGAEEYNSKFLPKGGAGRFDSTAYEEILKGFAAQEEQLEERQDNFTEPDWETMLGRLKEPKGDLFEEVMESAPAPDPEAVQVLEPVSEEVADVEAVPVSQPDLDGEEELAEVLAPVEVPTAETMADEEEAPAEIPVSQPVAAVPPESKERPAAQPVASPKAAPIKITPVSSAMNSKLKLIDIKKIPQGKIYIEEDILVPDVKPDLASILSMEGKVKLNQRELHVNQSGNIKVSGDLVLQTLYQPETRADGEGVIAIESKIPFKSDMEIKAGELSDLWVSPVVEAVDYTIINERKFKVRANLTLGIREYSKVDMELFEGIRDEEVQMLKEKICLTDVALRKKEPIEIKEELSLKENMPEIDKILTYDVNITENHKQINKEKAVINASVYCNVMYLTREAAVSAKDEEETPAMESTPVLYQGKTEFTQFIRLDEEDLSGGQNPAGSRIGFDISSLSLTAKEDGNGKKNLLELDMNVETYLELYKNVEKEVVTDVYHHLKEIQYDTEDIDLTSVSGSGVAEVSVREIINVPERYGNVDRVAYISGKVNEKSAAIEQGKNVVEGAVTFKLICVGADDPKNVFSITQDIPFRSSMEIPGITSDMTSDNDMMLKEVWFDKINNRQIEVNAGILMNTTVSKEENLKLVKKVSFLEMPVDAYQNPGIILYITRTGDNLWKIAKKYKTTIEEIRKINELGSARDVKPGTKLLIVAKNH